MHFYCDIIHREFSFNSFSEGIMIPTDTDFVLYITLRNFQFKIKSYPKPLQALNWQFISNKDKIWTGFTKCCGDAQNAAIIKGLMESEVERECISPFMCSYHDHIMWIVFILGHQL